MSFSFDEAKKATLEYFNNDEIATDVFLKKYALRDTDGNILEDTPDAMHKRLAKEFARIEKKYQNPMSEEEIYGLFKDFRWIVPQGSPMSGVGNHTKIQSISNCFLIASPEDSYGGILKCDQEQAQIMKRRGGVGFDISTIRPSGVRTANAAETTDGIAVFMERFSNTCREVAQGGRRGALMLTISCHHPDIKTFITIKRDLKKVTGANISIRLTDEFMKAVKADKEVELRFPVEKIPDNNGNIPDPIISEMISAKELWDMIIESAHSSAEPGILFWDSVIKNSPADCYTDEGFKTISTNPSLRGDTKVLTSNGVFDIKDLDGKNIVIKNLFGEWKQANAFLSGKNKQLIKITFTNNQSVYCTKEHKWPVLNTLGNVYNKHTGEPKKKLSIDLKSGDKIPFPSFDHIINNENCKFSNEDGFVVGWLYGDGWESYHKTNKSKQYGFIFNEDEKDIGYRVLSYTNSIAKVASSLRRDHGCKAFTYCTTDNNVINKFEEFGVGPKENGIPKSVWLGNDKYIKGFIDGLFSSDGYIEEHKKLAKSNIVFVSSRENLCTDLQKLLSFYGIKSNIKKSVTKSSFPNSKNYNKLYTRYDLVISGIFTKKFANHFTLSNSKKAKILESIKIKTTQSFDTKKTSYANNRDYLLVRSVELTDIYEDVYDITVFDETHTFLTEVGVTGNCSEITLSAYDSCRLLVVNLFSFVKDPFTKDAYFDYDKFADVTIKAQRLMDDLIDLELECVDNIIKKIKSDPEDVDTKKIELDLWKKIKNACINGRRTGLGITALGDAIAALGIRYGSNKSITITEEIYKMLAVKSYESSSIMAKERGVFPVYDYEKEKNHEFIQRIINESEYLKENYPIYGRRNIALTTTAPTGSVSIMTQTTSGIEPAFMLGYTRRRKINPEDKGARVDFVDEVGDRWQEYKIYHHKFKQWMDITGNNKEEESPYHKSLSNDIDWIASVKLQASAQKWVCHAISKTCNLPNDATKETVSDIYMEAWKSGCKGFTVYRDGSRSGVLVSTKEDDVTPKFTENRAPKRPAALPCDIHQVNIKGEAWTVLIGLMDGRPYEIFGGLSSTIEIPKKHKKGMLIKHPRKSVVSVYDLQIGEGEDMFTIKNVIKVFDNPTEGAFTRTISLALRHGAPIQFLTEQLQKDDKDSDMFSFSRVIARVLKQYIQDGTKASGECPECGSDQIMYTEGCLTCPSCGFGKCG